MAKSKQQYRKKYCINVGGCEAAQTGVGYPAGRNLCPECDDPLEFLDEITNQDLAYVISTAMDEEYPCAVFIAELQTRVQAQQAQAQAEQGRGEGQMSLLDRFRHGNGKGRDNGKGQTRREQPRDEYRWTAPPADNDITSRDNFTRDFREAQARDDHQDWKRSWGMTGQVEGGTRREVGGGEVVIRTHGQGAMGYQNGNLTNIATVSNAPAKTGGVEGEEEAEVWSNPPCVSGCPVAPKPKVVVPQGIWDEWMRMTLLFPDEWIAYLYGEEGEGHVWKVTGYYLPYQQAHGTECQADDREGSREGLIGAIHTHVGMKAFWSSVDVANRNWPVEIVFNREGMYLANFGVMLECGRPSRADGTLELDKGAVGSDPVMAELREKVRKWGTRRVKAKAEPKAEVEAPAPDDTPTEEIPAQVTIDMVNMLEVSGD